MSTLFFDHLVVIETLNKKIKKHADSNDELQELWLYVEELIHHKVIGCCLENLPNEHHNEFMEMFHSRPYDKEIISFLNSKMDKDIEKLIKLEIKKLTKELILLDSNKM